MFLRLTFTTLFLTVALALTANGQSAPAQKPAAAKTIARTPDGHPDLGGTWVNNSATPFERPKEVEGRQTLTDEEVVELNRRAKKIFFSGGSDAAWGTRSFLRPGGMCSSIKARALRTAPSAWMSWLSITGRR